MWIRTGGGWGRSGPQPRLEATSRLCQGRWAFLGLHACIDPILTTASLAGALEPHFREEKLRWGRPVAQWRPAQASGGWDLEPGPWEGGAPSKAWRNAGRRRGPAPPRRCSELAPRPPASHISHGPLLSPPASVWAALGAAQNRNSLRSDGSSGPACSVYELQQVTQPLWALRPHL